MRYWNQTALLNEISEVIPKFYHEKSKYWAITIVNVNDFKRRFSNYILPISPIPFFEVKIIYQIRLSGWFRLLFRVNQRLVLTNLNENYEMNRDDERFQLFSEYLFLHYIGWHYIISARQDGYFLIIFKIAEYITLETYEKVFFTPKWVRHFYFLLTKKSSLSVVLHIFLKLFLRW